MRLYSDAFAEGGDIPRKYSEDGSNISPPLRWTGIPDNARELALVMDDPDASRSDPWVHWVMYEIPASASGLPEGVPRQGDLNQPEGARQGVNSFRGNNLGYRGPTPPKGEPAHHYRFHLYALNTSLNLSSGITRAALERAIEGHVVAQTTLLGRYQR